MAQRGNWLKGPCPSFSTGPLDRVSLSLSLSLARARAALLPWLDSLRPQLRAPRAVVARHPPLALDYCDITLLTAPSTALALAV